MTEGRRALIALLQRTLGKYVAARCRVAASCVSEWASGRRRPSKRARAALELNYGIRRDEWNPPARRRAGVARCPK